jgi:hypothetical protein
MNVPILLWPKENDPDRCGLGTGSRPLLDVPFKLVTEVPLPALLTVPEFDPLATHFQGWNASPVACATFPAGQPNWLDPLATHFQGWNKLPVGCATSPAGQPILATHFQGWNSLPVACGTSPAGQPTLLGPLATHFQG